MPMKLLDDYFELRKKVFTYFGYEEDWKVIPLDDQTDVHWFLDQRGSDDGSVVWSDEPFTEEIIKHGGGVYSAEIFTYRHLDKFVYRGPEFTMVVVDTHTDGNKFLMVFDNAKECKDAAVLEARRGY